MAGYIYFSDHNGISLGSSGIDFLADYLKSYISSVGEEVVNKVYEVYDYYQSLSFNELSPDAYMKCYKQIRNALLEDTINNNELKPEIKNWMKKLWEEEIKPKMEQASIFRKELM